MGTGWDSLQNMSTAKNDATPNVTAGPINNRPSGKKNTKPTSAEKKEHDDVEDIFEINPNDNKPRTLFQEEQFEGNSASASTSTLTFKQLFTSQAHQLRFDGYVNTIDYSPDGNLLAVGGYDQNVTIYRIRGHTNTDNSIIFEPICQYPLGGKVYAVCFSPNSRYLAAGGDSKKLTIYDTNNIINTTTNNNNNNINISNTKNNMNFFLDMSMDMSKKNDLYCQNHITGGKIYTIAFSPDNKYIAVGANDKKVSIFCNSNQDHHNHNRNLNRNQKSRGTSTTNSLSFQFHSHLQPGYTMYTVQFSPKLSTSPLLAVGGADKKVTIYNIITGAIQHTISKDSEVNSIQYSNNNQLLAVGTYAGTVSLHNTTNYAPITQELNCRTLADSGYVQCTLTFSSNDNYIAIGCTSKKVLIYDHSSQSIIYEIPTTGQVKAIRYTPTATNNINDTYFSIGCGDKVLTYDTSCYKNVYQSYEGNGYIFTTTFSPNGKYLAIGGNRDKRLKVYRTINHNVNGSGNHKELKGSRRPELYCKFDEGHDDIVRSASFSMDGRYIASADRKGLVLIRDLVSTEEVKRFNRGGVVRILKYSPNGKYLAVGGQGRFVDLHDAKTYKRVKQFEQKDGMWVVSIDFSSDEKFLAVGIDENMVSIYNLHDNSLVKSLKEAGSVRAIVFSKDLKFLAVGGDFMTLAIYNVNDFGLARVYDRDGAICFLAFSPDSTVLAIGSVNGVVDFLQVHNEDDTKWEPYASPIYLPQKDWIRGISFVSMTETLAKNEQAEFYPIAIANGYTVTTMKLHRHSVTPPEILFQSDDDRVLASLLADKKKTGNNSALTRDEEEKTMISIAAEKNRLNLVERLLDYNPSQALVPWYYKGGNGHTCGNNGIMKYLEERYLLNSLGNIADGQFYKSSTPLNQVNEMCEVLMNLAQKQVNSSVIVKLLNAGEADCMDGFVVYDSIYVFDESAKLSRSNLLLSPLRTFSMLFRSNTNSIRLFGLPLTEQLKPRSSKTEEVLSAWQDLKRDNSRRVELKVLRGLLPNLTSFDSLKHLTNMRDNKPFACPSLHAAIDASWSSWAKKWFLLQLFLYVVWLISLSIFCEVTKQNKVAATGIVENHWIMYFLASLVGCGVVYFGVVEAFQIKVLSMEHYCSDSWNLWQWTIIVLASMTVALGLSPDTSESTYGYASAMSLFFSWIGLFNYLRGFENFAWINIALYRIGESLREFISVLALVIFSFSMTFRALHEARALASTTTSDNIVDNNESPSESAFGSIMQSLLTTFLAGIAGDFDLTDLDETYSRDLTLVLLIILLLVVSIVSLNALIAFISERFEVVLDEKNAVLKKQKAKVMLDLYCLFSENKRKKIEDRNRWTSLVIPAADLGLEEELSDMQKNVSRATKEDMTKFKKQMKQMNVATKEEMKVMQEQTMTEFNVMKENMIEMKDDMKVMKQMIAMIAKDYVEKEKK